MIGNGRKIQRPLNLRNDRLVCVCVRQGNRLSAGVAVGGIGIVALTRNVAVKRIAGMHMQVTEHRTFIHMIFVARLTLFSALERLLRDKTCAKKCEHQKSGTAYAPV